MTPAPPSTCAECGVPGHSFHCSQRTRLQALPAASTPPSTDPPDIASADILTAASDLRAMAASKNMSELAYFARSKLGQAFIAAASSWAALVRKPGSEKPARVGWYLTGEADSDQFDPADDFARGLDLNVLLWDGATWNAGDPAPDWWCPLVFPPVPEATDEG